MAVYKEEKTNTWRAVYRYTDWNGERKQTQKRGFKTKREAQAWEREQLNKTSADLDMTFKSFVDLYTADMKTRLKENTWATKDHIIHTKLLPYFGKLKMCNITAQQIITWQNEMLNHKDENGKPYSPVYLKTVRNQLSAIFNHAVRYYNLRENPCKKAGSMGKKKNREMMFWIKEQYLKFAEVMMDKPLSFYAFEMLYWCGIRDGALLMQKEKRTDSKATLEVVGRDQPDQRLYLSKDQESLIWSLDHAENELWKQPSDPILEAVAKIVSADNREWEGSPTELAQAIQTDMAVNRLTKHLNVNASRLLEEHQVKYENKTKHAGRRIRLTYMVVEAPAFEVIE